MARGKAWASIILGALCTLPGPANCEERIVAAWLTDGSNGKTTPAMAVALINNGSIAGETLRAAIGYPIIASMAFNKSTLPIGYSLANGSPVNDLEQYLLLTYTDATDVDEVISAIKSTGRFGYVGELPISSMPDLSIAVTDEFVTTSDWPDDNVQWGLTYPQWVSYNWESGTGTAAIGVLDSGPFRFVPDLDHAISLNHSYDLLFGTRGTTYWEANGNVGAHGTHVTGIIAARANNPVPGSGAGRGIAGICATCSIHYAAAASTFERSVGALLLSSWGAQAINFSGFIRDPGDDRQDRPDGTPCDAFQYDPNLGAHPFCVVLAAINAYDGLLIASAGNNLGIVQFPASDDLSIAVAGSQNLTQLISPPLTDSGPLWDEANVPLDASDRSNGCPSQYNESTETSWECGTNFGPEIDAIAPARHVISTFPPGASYVAGVCDDANFGEPNDGYAWCTGTSMAAPHVTGIVGRIRSQNPLLNAERVAAHIEVCASVSPNGTGYAVGNVISRMPLTSTSGALNSLTPMFVAHSVGVNAQDRVYTTKPTVAQAALLGTMLRRPLLQGGDRQYVYEVTSAPESVSRPYGTVLLGEARGVMGGTYTYPSAGILWNGLPAPQAPFYVFVNENSPYPGVPLVPLFRLSFTDSCDFRDHVYATTMFEVGLLESQDRCPGEDGIQSYKLEGLEGYILGSCPSQFSGCGAGAPGNVPQALHRRYSAIDDSYALLRGNQLALPIFQSYSQTLNGVDVIGFVFDNVDSDSDRLIDGHETLLGTNRLAVDSDGDGMSDGTEVDMLEPSRLWSCPLTAACVQPLGYACGYY